MERGHPLNISFEMGSNSMTEWTLLELQVKLNFELNLGY